MTKIKQGDQPPDWLKGEWQSGRRPVNARPVITAKEIAKLIQDHGLTLPVKTSVELRHILNALRTAEYRRISPGDFTKSVLEVARAAAKLGRLLDRVETPFIQNLAFNEIEDASQFLERVRADVARLASIDVGGRTRGSRVDVVTVGYLGRIAPIYESGSGKKATAYESGGFAEFALACWRLAGITKTVDQMADAWSRAQARVADPKHEAQKEKNRVAREEQKVNRDK